MGGGNAWADKTVTIPISQCYTISGTNSTFDDPSLMWLHSASGNYGEAQLEFVLDEDFNSTNIVSATLKLYCISKSNRTDAINVSSATGLNSNLSRKNCGTALYSSDDGKSKIFHYGSGNTRSYGFDGGVVIASNTLSSYTADATTNINVTDYFKTLTTKQSGDKVYLGLAAGDAKPADLKLAGYGHENASYLEIVYSEKENANYTVKYQDALGNDLKAADATHSGEVGSVPAVLEKDKDAIYIDGKKYVYSSDNASSVTIANDNSSTVIVVFAEVAKYSYTIVAEDADQNELQIIGGGSTFADENATMYIPLRILDGTTLRGISGENSWKSYTINSNNQVEKIAYSDITVNNVVAFVEGEKVAGAAECTPTGNLQLASCGHMGRGQNLLIGNVNPGKYTVTFHYVNTNGGDHPVTIKAGEVEVETINAAKSSRADYTTAEFTVTEATDITFSVGGSSTSGVDYAYIVKTGDVYTKTAGSTGFFTFSADCNVTVPAGATVYTSTLNGEVLTAEECDATVIPANTGVIIKGEAGQTYAFVATATAGDAITTALTAAPNGVQGNGSSIYGLLKDAMEFAVVNAEVKLNNNVAYLNTAAGARVRMVIGGEANGITNVAAAAKDGAIYNLAGQRVNANAKGIVIMNGKKFVK